MAKHKQKSQLPEEISWKAPNMYRQERSPFWYAMFALLSAGSIIFAIFYDGSVLTLITFILIIVSIGLFSFQSPKEIKYQLTSEGITIGQAFYPHKTIKGFWIEYSPPHTKTLSFETTAYINNKVSAQLGDQHPVLIKLYLTQFLYEDLDHQDSLRETLAKRLKI